MNNIDKLIIRRGKGNTEGLTYKYTKSTGEVITPVDTYSDLHVLDIGEIIKLFIPRFIILSSVSNTYHLCNFREDPLLSFTVWDYSLNNFVYIILDYRLNESELRYLLKKHR